MVPGVIEPELFGFGPGEVTQIVPEEYGARVLAAICRAALSHRDDGNGMFINYTQLPDIMWSSVLEFFQVNYGAEDLARMKEILKFDAKNPSILFDAAASAETGLLQTRLWKRLINGWANCTMNCKPQQ